MGEQSEEKTLPPTTKKLRDARKKGQVARSKDFVTGVSVAGALGLLVLAGGAALPAMTAMLDEAGRAAPGDFALGVQTVGGAARQAVTASVLPMLVLVPGAAVLAGIVSLRGIPFATDPISPKLERINPLQGLKRMFEMRAMVELGKTLLKAVIIVATLVAVLAGGLQSLVLAPSCGLGCVAGVFRDLFAAVAIAAAVLFIVTGGVDIGLQTWLFRRDQKMSVSEAKRERKEMEGNPEIRGERRRLGREAAQTGALGIKRATLLLEGAGQLVLGLRYKPGDTPVPLIVCRGFGERGTRLLGEAALLRIPVVNDPDVAAMLRDVPAGRFIPEASFKHVAAVLARAR